MPRPGFYNDNEYRAYPFIYAPQLTFDSVAAFPNTGETDKLYLNTTTNTVYRWRNSAYVSLGNTANAMLPPSAIVDAGFIMGIDAEYDETQHEIWLSEIKKETVNAVEFFRFVFTTNATNKTLTFTVPLNTDEWAIEYADSAVIDGAGNTNCADEPVWSGFIVTGPLQALRDIFDVIASPLVFTPKTYVAETCCVQNLHKAYLRSISVGNYSRAAVPNCGNNTVTPRTIIANARCIKGDIRLKEGYNCQITQTDRVNEIIVGALKGAGAQIDEELCEHGSEIALYPGEPLANNSVFYSGGPSCEELITTINGLGGPNVNIIGGAGINVTVENGAIKIQKRPNASVNCA